MAKNKRKERFMAAPIERHDTAAWRSHIEDVEAHSQVGIPSETAVRNAKEYVDTNEK